jgi:phosphate-selective porin OprO/OprP
LKWDAVKLVPTNERSATWRGTSSVIPKRVGLIVFLPALFAATFNAWAEGGSPPVGAQTTNVPPAEVKQTNIWQFHWQEGLNYQFRTQFEFGGTNRLVREHVVEEVKLSGKIGGLLQVDAAGYQRQSGTADYEDGIELRRARIYARGDWKLLLPVNYKIQIGYDNPDFVLYDLYFWWQDVPLLNRLKLGYFKVPMTLAGYESSRSTLMMERASPVGAFYPSQRTGLQVGGPEFRNRATWALGIFSVGQELETGNITSSDLQVVGRLTGVPWFSDEEGQAQKLLHLGVSGNYSFSSDSVVRYRSRPESHLAPFVVDTGDLNAQNSVIFGGEAAWVQGAFSVQGEYLHAYALSVNGVREGDFSGAYVSASWFLTGETRPYHRDTGTFRAVRPRHNFSFKTTGIGALELVGQASYLDLTDGGIDGGRMAIIGAGLNWHWSPMVKWQFNGLFSRVNGGATPGDAFIVQARAQLAL